MTPCEEKGYKIGDEFVVTEKTLFQKGARVRLSEDDGTNDPAFKGVGCKAEDGTDWHYIHLSLVRKVDADTDDGIITRTNGQPFATVASARQQLATKGLQDTHEAVPHEGGYALVPIQRVDDPITLQPGDYVSTEGMTEEQYHAVANAFMGAGAVDSGNAAFKRAGGWAEFLGWDDGDNELWHAALRVSGFTGRHLTIEQVLGAANAGTTITQPEETTMTTDPITTLKQARQARDEAEQAYQEALGEAREYLGDGFMLAEVGVDWAAPDEDMTDPANWREGDVFECVDGGGWGSFENGGLYPITGMWSEGVDLNGTPVCDQFYSDFKFHHRPA